MPDDPTIRTLNAEIDRLLGIEAGAPSAPSALPPGSRALLAVASRLAGADFDAELRPQPDLRARWASTAAQPAPPARAFHLRWAWAILAAVLVLAALFAFRQPVLAAVGRLFGYGYFPEAGFVPLDNARVLRSPVEQEHAGASLTALRGLATPGGATLWLEYSDAAWPGDGAWLETPEGARIELKTWAWDPDRADTRGVRLEFPALPANVSRVTLALPEGWRLPLEWIPAVQAGVPSAAVSAPYPTAQPEGENTSPPCVDAGGLRVCLTAAQTDPDGTRVLLEATSSNAQLTPGAFPAWLVSANPLANDQEVTLTDDLGNVIPFPQQPFDSPQAEGERLLQPLSFPPVSAQARRLTLRVPAFEASTTFAEPLSLSVDLGPDPQPGQSLAVDQELSILGQTVRFHQATLEGDGASSLRLTLYSDPLQINDGMLVAGLDLGKPEGIDDLYGSGGVTPQGQIKVYTELIGSLSGKKTGLLTFPIVGARVLLVGPFELSFPAPAVALASATQTPQVVSGEDFTPQPTPTPLPLDSYHYDGKVLQAGDLLFSVVGDATTALYAAGPQSGFTPERVATLPGQVYQVFVHPDRQGIDYLAGTRVTEDGFTFYRSVQVFTLRFEDARPRLLAAFPRGPQNVKGTELTADWSSDGRLMVFQLSNFAPKQGEPTFKIGWIDLACRETGNCRPQYFQLPQGLAVSLPQFLPQGYRLMMAGSYIDGSTSGMSDIFLLEFGADLQPGALVNLTESDQIDELVPRWDSKSGRVVALCPTDPSEAQRQFCFYDPASGARQEGSGIDQHLFDYQIEPDGERILGVDINHRATDGKSAIEVRLYDWNGKSGPVLASAQQVDQFEASPDGRYFAYLNARSGEIHLVDIARGGEIFPPDGANWKAMFPGWDGCVDSRPFSIG